MKGRPPKWKKLLDDPEVQRWHDQLALGSINTAEERIRVLGRFCELNRTTPAKLAALGKDVNGGRRAVEDMLMDFVGRLTKQKKSPGYIENYVKSVKSWLLHNEVALVRKIRVGDAKATPSLENERIPHREELHGAIMVASDRGKVEIALCAFSGVRPEVQGYKKGTDGLRLRDIPDLKIREGRVAFTNIPARVIVRKNLSKIKRPYFTFAGHQSCGYIRAYLERRMAQGEALGPDSPVVRVEINRERQGRPVDGSAHGSAFLTTSGITKDVRAALRTQKPEDGAREFRPYILRSVFDTCLEMAQREGKITDDDRKFMMGRAGCIDRVYTTGKAILPPDVIEQMRKEYAECTPYLETVAPPPGISVTSEQDQRVDELLERINRLERAVERAAIGKFEELGARTTAEELRRLGEVGGRRR